MERILILLAVCLGMIATPLKADDAKPVAIIISPLRLDGAEIGPGGAPAHIVGLKKGGDGFVSVRAAPTTRATELGRLAAGTFVIAVFPSEPAKNQFVGVIYDRAHADTPIMETCGLSETPPYQDGPYTGPCAAGWVHQRFVEVLAD